jgi:hypothetical protein
VFEILTRLTDEQFPEGEGSKVPLGNDMKPFGEVTSVTARKIHAAEEALKMRTMGLTVPEGVKHHRQYVLAELFAAAALEERTSFPKQGGVQMRDGWKLVSPKGIAPSDDGRGPADSILRTYVGRIVEIFGGKVIEVSGTEIVLEPRGEDEDLLYVVEDARLHSLRMLLCQLKAEERQQTPAALIFDDEDNRAAWQQTIAPVEAEKVFDLIDAYRTAQARVEVVFFGVVRELMPHGHVPESLELRQNWQIVEGQPTSSFAGSIAIPLDLSGLFGGGPFGGGSPFGGGRLMELLRMQGSQP